MRLHIARSEPATCDGAGHNAPPEEAGTGPEEDPPPVHDSSEANHTKPATPQVPRSRVKTPLLRLVRQTEAPPQAAPSVQRLVIVGAGMVAHKLCERLQELGQLGPYQVTVIGEEPCLAYDRVNLSSMLVGRTAEQLTLKPKSWFQNHSIDVHTGDAVETIDPEQQRVVTFSGQTFAYDKLVLATGSRAIRPKIQGAELPGVHVFRSQADAEQLEPLIERSNGAGAPIAIVGAGLLGLELAERVCDRGGSVALVEAGSHILPRQLTEAAANAAQSALTSLSFQMFFNARVEAIRQGSGESLTLQLSDGQLLRAVGVVFAVGVRPRDELARAAGLQCDLYGGVDVNRRLETSVRNIYAVGECVRHNGLAFGLIAPGYQMAEVLAQRLAGKNLRFVPPQPAVHLKMKALELSAVGRSSIASGLGIVNLVYEQSHALRTVVVENHRIVGASAVGEWEEFGQVSGAIARSKQFRSRHARRFLAGKSIYRHTLQTAQSWPADAVVCSCTGVDCAAVRSALRDGCGTRQELTSRTGAGSVCGSCHPTLEQLAGAPVRQAAPSPWLWGAASLALVSVVVISSAPPIPYSESVEAGWHVDMLWRSDILKQVSGYSLLALFALAAAFSIRKRWTRLRWGQLDAWRSAHSLIGASAVLGTIAHTGMRLGKNLDLALMLTFFAVTVLGAGTGLVMTLSAWLAPSRSMSLRRYWSKAHLWATWPLPVLLAIHIFRAYYF